MRNYIKYIVLFIILVLIGIGSVTFYTNCRFQNDFKSKKSEIETKKEQDSIESKKSTEDDSSKSKKSTEDDSIDQKQNNNQDVSNLNNSNSTVDSSSANNTNTYSSSQSFISENQVEKSSTESISNYNVQSSSVNSVTNENSDVINNNVSQSSRSAVIDQEEYITIEVDNSSYTPVMFSTDSSIDSSTNSVTIEVDRGSISTNKGNSSSNASVSSSETSGNNTNTSNVDSSSKTNGSNVISSSEPVITSGNIPSSVTKITLNKNVVAIGEKKTVVSRGKQYLNNTVQLNVNGLIPNSDVVVWSVVKGSQYVKVNSSGKVTAITGGTAIVRASLKSNPEVYADCEVTVIHSLYENVEVTKNLTVIENQTNKKVKLEKGTKAILHGTIKTKKTNVFIEIVGTNQIVTIDKKYLKFKSYYVENKYSKKVYESYINDRGFTSKTDYLIWVNTGTQRLILFKKDGNNKWNQVENFVTSTGDVEGKYGSGGNAGVHFDLEVQDFNSEPANPGIGRAIHVQFEDTQKNYGNTIHIGALPKNSDGGNASVTRPSSHGCPHLSVSSRDKLYNTYNQKSSNKLIHSKVIYY